MIYDNRFIYGKNPLPKIVNISVKNDVVHIFQRINDEVIELQSKFKPWVLSPYSKKDTTKLNGKQHFQYLKEYTNIEDFNRVKKDIYKFGLFNIANQSEAVMVKSGITYFKDMTPEDLKYLSFDIETSGTNPKAKDAEVYLITTSLFYKGELIEEKTFDLHNYSNSKEMIKEWCDYVIDKDPDVLTGHNIVMFDLEYLNAIAGSLPIGRDLSPLNIATKSSELRKDGSQTYSYFRKNIFGREIIDTFFLAIKYDVKRAFESYALKPIIKAIDKEVEGRVYIDPSKIKQYFNDEEMWEKVVQYAQQDSKDPYELIKKMIPVNFYMAQVVPRTFQQMVETASGGQINAVLLRAYIQDGYAIPKASELESLKGAISFAIPGIYHNVQKIDFKALYPSIMLQYQICNEQKDYLRIFPKIVEYFAKQRESYRKLYNETNIKTYDDLQEVAKTVANSCYGFLSTNGLNFNSPEDAAFITAKARELLSFSIKWATNKEVDYWINLFNERTGKDNLITEE